MTTMIAIYGGGGVAREVAWLLSETQPVRPPSMFIVADRDWMAGTSIDGINIVPEREFDVSAHESITAYIAIGSPAIRQAVYERLGIFTNIKFPPLIHASTRMDVRPGKTTIGPGVIIYPLTSLTTDVVLGGFTQVNPGATIGHGARIGNCTTICPGANISGEVIIGAGCFIGAGAIIKEGVQVADGSTIGAGAVVINDILEAGTWVGVPARRVAR